jgi:NADPH:quinone reductase-like Zn-dependent oxidoreductase
MSFEEAAAVPLAAMTALQSFRLYKGDLSGKTVFIPAGCMFSLAHVTPHIDKGQ